MSLTKQETTLALVKGEMQKGGWITLYELKDRLYDNHAIVLSDAAVSARVRDLRKAKYGAHTVERKRVGSSNTYKYRLLEAA